MTYLRALVAAAALLCASPAFAHSWYSAVCCNDKDCAPLPTDAVKATAGGWYVTTTGETIPYGDKREQQSQDSDFHACIYPPMAAEGLRGKIRCLYVPRHGFLSFLDEEGRADPAYIPRLAGMIVRPARFCLRETLARPQRSGLFRSGRGPSLPH